MEYLIIAQTTSLRDFCKKIYEARKNGTELELNLDEINARIQVQKNFYFDKKYDKKLDIHYPRQIKNAEYVLTVLRNGEKLDINVKNITSFEVKGKTYYSPGIAMQGYVKYSVGEAFLDAVPYAFQTSWDCLVIISKLVTFNYDISNRNITMYVSKY